MPNNYYANQRISEENDIQHWRYLRREKRNGKWKYYYEKDDTRLNVKKEKYKFGKDIYTVRDKYDPNNFRFVDKDTYDKTKDYKLYVGDKRLSSVAKTQINIGKAFIRDLFNGKVHFGK